ICFFCFAPRTTTHNKHRGARLMSAAARELTMTYQDNREMAAVRTALPAPPRPGARGMRVLMLSWEYPPVVVGGLVRHVHALARHLVRQGHEVVVLCRHAAGTDAGTHPRTDRVVEGVRIIRVAEDPMHVTLERDLVPWTL